MTTWSRKSEKLAGPALDPNGTPRSERDIDPNNRSESSKRQRVFGGPGHFHPGNPSTLERVAKPPSHQ